MKVAIARETVNLEGHMINRGRKFYLRSTHRERHGIKYVKLCNQPTNFSSIGDFGLDIVMRFFDIVDE
ncbi:hypothetical protein AAY81_05075 [Denitrobacterium detoxificans]|uniref:Uncharacterized protein n=1 Tax=Denitrobacterium detoxificans TaxID=79604 RepID=A0A172RY05_9ACTN|nr:hypothetical protein [Denitrobacterium detoxificans]ANE22599.1 hypothetical protein AAY81_05075 [Denitrobacterium detoxificans]SEO92215.1 hypothetical protein SAMN02910314_01642 [Denitrobacterium detoxificans]